MMMIKIGCLLFCFLVFLSATLVKFSEIPYKVEIHVQAVQTVFEFNKREQYRNMTMYIPLVLLLPLKRQHFFIHLLISFIEKDLLAFT